MYTAAYALIFFRRVKNTTIRVSRNFPKLSDPPRPVNLSGLLLQTPLKPYFFIRTLRTRHTPRHARKTPSADLSTLGDKCGLVHTWRQARYNPHQNGLDAHRNSNTSPPPPPLLRNPWIPCPPDAPSRKRELATTCQPTVPPPPPSRSPPCNPASCTLASGEDEQAS